jgi:hypothetical protein
VSQALTGAAGALRQVGAALRGTAADLSTVDPGLAAFGGGAEGALGELARSMYTHWSSALHARAGEATRHADRLDQLADLVVEAAQRYDQAEDSARWTGSSTLGGVG